jgi:MacB-like periplasmic core domain/FtsX-like permease family
MFVAEFKYSLRNLWNARGFSLTAVLTLALGIGASTAVFTVLDSVILKQLSYRDSGNLVVIWERVKYLASRSAPYTGPNPRHEAIWKERAGAFRDLCLIGVGTRGVSVGAAHPQLVGSLRAQANFLNVLAVNPLLGRNFTPEDTVKGHDRVVILSYSMWQRVFNGASDVTRKTLRIADLPYEIVGVLTITRIKTLDAEVNDSLASERFQTFILISFGVAGLLLAMLGVYAVLSYAIAGRTREIGVRMALGATRRRIYWLTLWEAAAPVFGGLAAGWAANLMAGELIEKLLYGVKTDDWGVAGIVALVLLTCASAGAFLPARRAASVDPMQALRSQ